MIYDTIDKSLLSLGNDETQFESGVMTSVYYDGGVLQIAERDRYVQVDGIETNQFNKKQMMIKSKTLSKMILDIIEGLQPKVNSPISSPLLSDGCIRVTVLKKTRFTKLEDRSLYVKNLDKVMFDACISLNIPTIFTTNNKTTLQVSANEVVVTRVRVSDLDIDIKNLKLAD